MEESDTFLFVLFEFTSSTVMVTSKFVGVVQDGAEERMLCNGAPRDRTTILTILGAVMLTNAGFDSPSSSLSSYLSLGHD